MRYAILAAPFVSVFLLLLLLLLLFYSRRAPSNTRARSLCLPVRYYYVVATVSVMNHINHNNNINNRRAFRDKVQKM